MKVRWTWRWCSGVCIAIIAVFCLAQKPDEWAMQNAQIGPDNPIDARAGTSHDAQAMYPVPDGPLVPLKATVAWSIAPAVKGISIDAKSGKISVDAGVPHGATTTVHANVGNGRRRLTAKLYVFRPEENPLVGRWRVDLKVACGEAEEMKVPESRHTPVNGSMWRFHVDRQFWIGREMSIAAYTGMKGSYEYDLNNRQ